MELIEAELSHRIIGCCIEVHRVLGPGFVEKVYEEAVAVEFARAGLAFERQKLVVV
jgi:GxxExxY protein